MAKKPRSERTMWDGVQTVAWFLVMFGVGALIYDPQNWQASVLLFVAAFALHRWAAPHVKPAKPDTMQR